MEPSIDELWTEVKTYYERTYFDPKSATKKKMRFHTKPDDKNILELHKSMKKLSHSMNVFYDEQPMLLDRLYRLLGRDEKK